MQTNFYVENVIPYDKEKVVYVNDIYILADATAQEVIALFNEAENEVEHRKHLIQIDALMQMLPQYAKEISMVKSIRIGGKVEVLSRDGACIEIHRASENLVYAFRMNTYQNQLFAPVRVVQPMQKAAQIVEENKEVQYC